jgi:hypothetical protein
VLARPIAVAQTAGQGARSGRWVDGRHLCRRREGHRAWVEPGSDRVRDAQASSLAPVTGSGRTPPGRADECDLLVPLRRAGRCALLLPPAHSPGQTQQPVPRLHQLAHQPPHAPAHPHRQATRVVHDLTGAAQRPELQSLRMGLLKLLRQPVPTYQRQKVMRQRVETKPCRVRTKPPARHHPGPQVVLQHIV